MSSPSSSPRSPPSSCPYKDIFGKPNTGIHSYRVMDIAIVDFLGTLIAAFALGKFTNTSVIVWFALLMVLSVIAHKMMCVDTTLTKYIFP